MIKYMPGKVSYYIERTLQESEEIEEESDEQEETEDKSAEEVATLKGRIITENINGEHSAVISLINVRSGDKQMIETNSNGSFELQAPFGIYNIVIEKPGYLKYTIKNIEATDICLGERSVVSLGEKKLLAGDFNGDGVVTTQDSSLIVARNRAKEGDRKYDALFDLTGDRVIDRADIDILVKQTTNKRDIIEEWRQ